MSAPTCQARNSFGDCGAPADLVAGIKHTCCGATAPMVYFCNYCFDHLNLSGECLECDEWVTGIITEPVRLRVSA